MKSVPADRTNDGVRPGHSGRSFPLGISYQLRRLFMSGLAGQNPPFSRQAFRFRDQQLEQFLDDPPALRCHSIELVVTVHVLKQELLDARVVLPHLIREPGNRTAQKPNVVRRFGLRLLKSTRGL